ncbi:MAG: hypothetical protein IJ087_09250 [Eggerthellaceae bacterium]|nr:hypothetical protein [Eggerthellaceae bacterium]
MGFKFEDITGALLSKVAFYGFQRPSGPGHTADSVTMITGEGQERFIAGEGFELADKFARRGGYYEGSCGSIFPETAASGAGATGTRATGTWAAGASLCARLSANTTSSSRARAS